MRKVQYNFVIDPAVLLKIKKIKIRDGIAESEQIRRGIVLWLKSKGVKVDAEKPRESRRTRTK